MSSYEGNNYGGDRRYSGGRSDNRYGGGGIRREDNYQSENSLNQGQGEASSYYNSNDNFQSSGRNDGGQDENRYENERPQKQNLEAPTSRYGAERKNSYQNENQNDDGDEFSSAARHANQHAGSSADPDIFSSVLSALGQNRQSIANQDVDEQGAVQSHQQYFGGNGNQPTQATSGSMGSAAAMQALKLFLGNGNQQGSNQQGNTPQGQNQSQHVEGNPQNQFIGMALAEASKLFDHQSSQGNVPSGTSKQSVVQQAGEMALKMYLKGQGGSGAGGLLGKFL